MPEQSLLGKTAIVTGAGRGIGRSTARALAERGVRVVVTARSQDQIDTVAAEISDAGGTALAVRADVSREADVLHLVERIGTIDIVINNAGTVQPISPLAQVDVQEWREGLDINLMSVVLMCRHTLPGMLERGWGRIVNVSSGAARGSVAGWSSYAAAKAGVEALTATLAREVGDADIRVVAVRPGIVDTAMQGEIRASDEEHFGRENLERFRSYRDRGLLRAPEDPARLILWLLSEEAESSNGQTVAIDDPEVAARIGLQPMGR